MRPVFSRLTAGALCLALATPASAQTPPPPVQGPTGALDGEATPASCAPFGFRLAAERRTDRIVATGAQVQSRAYPGPPPPPPPPPPSAPPPPPPPPPAMMQAPASPSRPPVIYTSPSGQQIIDGVVVSGSRIRQPFPSQPGEPERYPEATPNPVVRVADQPVSTFSIDVDTASYANVRRFIEDGAAPPRDAVRVEEMINAFDYDYARPDSATEPFAVTTVVADAPWAEGRQILHVGLQGYELPESQRRPLNLTFLVDVSGSMGSPDKLELAQRAMNLIIDRLRPQDTVAVTYYAEGAGTTLAPTPGDQKLRLRCAVESLYASGGTAGAAGMTNAYDQARANLSADRVNRILMFTDGDFNVGVTNDQTIEDYVADQRDSGIYLSVYGFGRGNYQDARMQTISQAGNGVAAYVDDLNEARRLFGPAFDRGAFPIADDVKIQVEFNPARVAEYRLIGYETRLLDEADFNNDAVDAGEVGSGASVTALYEITPVGGPSQIGERRYEAPAAAGNPSGELAFVQVRYKLPGQDQSVLMQHPVAGATSAPPESTRWATAIAAYGQKLRDDPWLPGDYAWSDILALAQGARGEDPFGQRAEAVQLIRAASELPPREMP